MTASTSAPEARMAARSITLPPDGSGRERRTSSARIASSGGGAWSTSSTAGACVASATRDFCGKVMVSFYGYRVVGLVTTVKERQRHVQRDAPGFEALHHWSQSVQCIWPSRTSTDSPNRLACAVEADLAEWSRERATRSRKIGEQVTCSAMSSASVLRRALA